MGIVGRGTPSSGGMVYVFDMFVSMASLKSLGTVTRVYDHGRRLGFPDVYLDAPGTL